MTKTALLYSSKYLHHKTGPGHPESPSRLRVILRELNKSGILENDNCSIVEPETIDMKDLELVHDIDYIKKIVQFCICGGGLLDTMDTMVSSESCEIAFLAAGGTVKATDLVMNGAYNNAFALVRPPGHHAGPDYPMGFCIFNNVALATSHLLEKYKLERIAILDIDAHHGNGTQDFFYKNKKVLFVSMHEDPIEFPLTGFLDEMGKDKGLGYTVNVPLPYGTDDRIYLKAFKEIVFPIINQYKPQFIFISTGFDGHYADPVGNLYLSSLCYTKIFDAMLESASTFCQGKIVAVLEGGYNLRFIGKMASLVAARLARIPYLFKDKHRGGNLKIRKKGETVIKQVKKHQSSFWNIG
jgi:acetoin utilization deacetylase AcuC-like enzyme